MAKRKYATAMSLGLMLAGGTIAVASSASASVVAGQRLAGAPTSATAVVTGVQERPRCRYVRGHFRWDYRRGHRVWVPRHRVCW
jgi:hypothetical protein